MNPHRPHRFQISDSWFIPEPTSSGWAVVETWWEIDKHGERSDGREVVAYFDTLEDALSEAKRRAREQRQ